MEMAAEKLVMNNTKGQMDFDHLFPIVEASKLSLDDEFLKHQPETLIQASIKTQIEDLIKSGGISDFRHPIFDPAVNMDKDLFFEAGNLPAVGHTLKWWKKKISMFMREKKFRIGTKKHYCAFLGVLIKYLIEEEEYEVGEAWRVVCDDSRNLGHYRNSAKAKNTFELTGSRKIGKWCDLANCFKIILSDDGTRVFLASGYYYSKGDESSLATIDPFYILLGPFEGSVAWIICDV